MTFILGKIRVGVLALALASPLLLCQPAPAADATDTQVLYRSAEIDGVEIA